MSSLDNLPFSEDDPNWAPRPLTRAARTGSWYHRLAPLSLNAARTRTSGQVPPESDNDELVHLLEKARNRFCFALTGSTISDIKHSEQWKWYCEYLEARAAVAWAVCASVLTGVSADTATDSIQAKGLLYASFAIVAESLCEDGEVYLATIVEKLQRAELVQQHTPNDALVRFVFLVIGWISALWDPQPDSDSFQLRLCSLKKGVIRNRSARRGTPLSIMEASNQSVRRIANRFGGLIPVPRFVPEEDPRMMRDAEAAWITTAYLSYHSLVDLVKIKLVWTGTLAEHLDYDSRNKSLYVFKHPSACLLMYKMEGDTILSRLFECERREANESEQSFPSTFAGFEDYLLELLQSYSLIFGSHKKSRKAMAQLLGDISGHDEPVDPLLKLLCTKAPDSSDLVSLYNELELETPDNHVPISEFTFLANKLLHLQRVSMGHNPHTLRRLWNDRRNPTTWFALFAVLIIGVGTLVFQILQLVFQIYQVPSLH